MHKVCTKARLLGERSVRIREVKGSNPSRSTNLPHRFVRCGVFYAQKTLADRAGLRILKSDANRVGSSMYFLKIHRFHASFKNRLLLRWAVILRDANNNFNFLHTIDNPPPKPNLYHSIWKIGCSSHFRIDRALRCRVL